MGKQQKRTSLYRTDSTTDTTTYKKYIKKEPDKLKRPKTPAELGFDKIWGIYPKRYGTNSKLGALKQYNARIKEGEEIDKLNLGTVNYGIYCEENNKTNTEFVMTAAKFFGHDKHYLSFQSLQKKHQWYDEMEIGDEMSKREIVND